MRLLISFGTRPEYIKVKSLVENMPECKTLFTGQHKDLLKDVKCDRSINIDNNNCTTSNRLNHIMASILLEPHIFDDIDYVMVQGDTTSALAVAMSAFNYGKTVIHLEAGLRTHDTQNPYPEELNRQLISRIANIHLCPTEHNRINLLEENANGDIYVTGNTGLDNIAPSLTPEYGNKILVTMHRRDNLPIIDKWFTELSKLAIENKHLQFIIPMHPNPHIMKYRKLLKGIYIVEPLDHSKLITFIRESRFIISDSGGIQEEASLLNKKVIVCREYTERTETLDTHSILCPKPNELKDIFDIVSCDYEINKPCPYLTKHPSGKAWIQIKEILMHYT